MGEKPMHSPGPWWSLPGNNYIMSAVAAGGRPVCRMDDLECSAAERTANKALVQAAPAMLAALREAMAELHDSAHSSGDPDHPNNMQSDAVVYRLCRDTIAMAENRA